MLCPWDSQRGLLLSLFLEEQRNWCMRESVQLARVTWHTTLPSVSLSFLTRSLLFFSLFHSLIPSSSPFSLSVSPSLSLYLFFGFSFYPSLHLLPLSPAFSYLFLQKIDPSTLVVHCHHPPVDPADRKHSSLLPRGPRNLRSFHSNCYSLLSPSF